nr:reverse transcriptase domain-containing protein [Tanacetum cinerariifolium]
MCTRNSYFPNNSSVTIPRRRNKRLTPNVEPKLRTIVEIADNHTMKELLQAPTEGYGEAILIPEINADQFETKTNLIQLVQANPDVPNDVIKLMMFPYSLEGNARVWENASKTDDMIDKLADQISTLVDIFAKKVATSAPVKAVEESCVTCGGPHAHYNFPNTDCNKLSVCVATGTYNQVAHQNRASNFMAPPGFGPMQNSQNRFNQNQRQGNNFNRGNNFQPSQVLNQGFQNQPFQVTNNPVQQVMLLKKLPEKLGDPSMFLISCDFPRMDVCHALADLGASINLMPLSIWKNLSLPELTPTRMTLELLDRSITHPKGVAEDIFVKVGKFHFLTDFVVVDFEADPRVPLILGRSFLRTDRALVDVYKEEITLRVNDEAVTFNLNKTTRYSSTYDDLSVNWINIIDVSREEYAQEILGFSKNSSGGNPTSTSEPILSDSSPSLTPFEGSDFILEEIEAYLKDESILLEIDHTDCDPEGDICLTKKMLNNDPFQLLSMDLKQGKVVKAKFLIEEPPELELKDLPSHLEYAYLEGVDKLPVIIAKDLKVDEKEALLKVLKSHKRAIAWKITDIKDIDPRFYTHKILMEEDYKPAVQCQRRVNPKIHEVIKKEIIKLLDARMIYPISDSPWVSPIHYVPKNGGITVVENENNELISTRLVTGWRVCIDYRKLNDAIRKDHFPLPFMDQMLERLAGNQFYCFLDGFSGYFQILINIPDQEKTTFTCPYGTFAYRRMPFGLCNAPGIFQRRIMAIFYDMIEKTMEVFMDDFSVFGDSFSSCLSHLDTMLQRHMTHLLEKETPFVFSKDCIDAFETLKKKLTEAPILVVHDWNLPFELMCDASVFAIGTVLGQRKTKYFQPIHFASKTMTEAQIHYTTTEKEMLTVVYAFEKFRPYLALSKSIVYTDHSALKYLLSKQDAKPRYILVAVDNLSKWVEAKALPTNDARVVVKFLKSLFARFGTP